MRPWETFYKGHKCHFTLLEMNNPSQKFHLLIKYAKKHVLYVRNIFILAVLCKWFALLNFDLAAEVNVIFGSSEILPYVRRRLEAKVDDEVKFCNYYFLPEITPQCCDGIRSWWWQAIVIRSFCSALEDWRRVSFPSNFLLSLISWFLKSKSQWLRYVVRYCGYKPTFIKNVWNVVKEIMKRIV